MPIQASISPATSQGSETQALAPCTLTSTGTLRITSSTMSCLGNSDRTTRRRESRWASALLAIMVSAQYLTMANFGIQPIKWENPFIMNCISAQQQPIHTPLSISPATRLNSNKRSVTQDPSTSAGPIIPSSPNATSSSHRSTEILMLLPSQEHSSIKSHISMMVGSIRLMLAGHAVDTQLIETFGLAHSLKATLLLIQSPVAFLLLFIPPF